MKVCELIELLRTFKPDDVIVIERDDEYWHIADVDTAELEDPDATNPEWKFKVDPWAPDYDTPHKPNAVRICM